MQQLSPAQQYDANLAAMRHTEYMDYPSHVHIETLARCNAACYFCPYPVLDRKGTQMDDTLINKILADLADIPRHLPLQLSPFKVGEPFLDSRLFDILHRINAELPNANISLTSNASPITEKTLLALTKIRNIKYLWISFNDHREAEYEQAMRLPYKRTIERLDMIHDQLTDGKLRFRVTLSRVGDQGGVDREFAEWISRRYPAFTVSIFPRAAWLGQVDVEVGPVPNIGCNRWFELSITATGVVAHCCTDGQAEWPIGDVTDQHVLEIYNSPHYRALRESTVSRLQAEPCNQCTFT